MHGSRRRQQRRVQPHVEDSRGVSSPALKGATTHIEELWASVSVFPGRPRSKRRSKVTRGGRLPCHTLRPVGKIAASRWCGGARASKLTVHTSALEIKCLTDTGPRTARKKGVGRCVLQSAAYGDASARKGRSDTCKSQQQRTHAHKHAPMCTHTYTRTHTPTCASARTHARI